MRKIKTFTAALASFCLLAGTFPASAAAEAATTSEPQEQSAASHTCYEVFVYSFYDSDGDGIGDLKGLEEKLDYINDGDAASGDDLGCDMIWLMPIFPSPTYHKYDATNYMDVDSQYGTLEDFDSLIAVCHERGVRVILDLAFNHTSSEHPWFTQAADYLRSLPEGAEPDAEACQYVDYYNFSREQKSGYEPLPESGWYYEARFWSGMPDLNLDSETVKAELADILSFWQERGADGFRLDAVTSYYTEDAEKSIDFVGWITDTVKANDGDAYLVAEAWTDQDAYAEYYRSGIDSMFDFAFSGAEGYIASIVRGKKDASIYGKRLASEEKLYARYSENYTNAPFYTNHDMARSAGYYSRDDGSRVKLAMGLNLLMPGNAFIYYGEELGMKGSGKDENKRAPMYWSGDPEAEGMCAGPPDMDSVGMKFAPEEEQSGDEGSILSYVRKAIRLRADCPVIAEGRTKLLSDISGREICAITRTDSEDGLLIVINTSAEPQTVDLADAGMEGYALTEMLCVSEEEAVLEGSVLTLPAFGMAILSDEG